MLSNAGEGTATTPSTTPQRTLTRDLGGARRVHPLTVQWVSGVPRLRGSEREGTVNENSSLCRRFG